MKCVQPQAENVNDVLTLGLTTVPLKSVNDVLTPYNYDVQHGLANAILMPYVLAFNAPTCEAQLARAASAMGAPATAHAAIDAIRRLGAAVGIPLRLSQAGVNEAFIPQMAQDAFESGNAQLVNPRKPTLGEVSELYWQAL